MAQRDGWNPTQPEEMKLQELLELLRGDVAGAEANATAEAEAAEPWGVVPAAAGLFGVLAAGEDVPEVLCRSREMALLVAAVLPSTGREPLVEVGQEAGQDGFPLLSARGEILGFVRHFRPELASALHVVDYLRRSPLALARLLRAAAGASLSRAARIMLSGGIEQVGGGPPAREENEAGSEAGKQL